MDRGKKEKEEIAARARDGEGRRGMKTSQRVMYCTEREEADQNGERRTVTVQVRESQS